MLRISRKSSNYLKKSDNYDFEVLQPAVMTIFFFYNNLKLFFDIFRSDSENSLSSEPSSQFLAMSKLPPPFNNGAGKAFKIFPWLSLNYVQLLT